MNEKELAYNLYNMKLNMKLGDSFSGYERVPGGWVFWEKNGTVFIPFNNEFQELGNRPTNIKATLRCLHCGTDTIHFVKEEFQGNMYVCMHCAKEFEYDHKEYE